MAFTYRYCKLQVIFEFTIFYRNVIIIVWYCLRGKLIIKKKIHNVRRNRKIESVIRVYKCVRC